MVETVFCEFLINYHGSRVHIIHKPWDRYTHGLYTYRMCHRAGNIMHQRTLTSKKSDPFTTVTWK